MEPERHFFLSHTIADNEIGDRGVEALADALQANTKLKHLYLQGESCFDDCFYCASEARLKRLIRDCLIRENVNWQLGRKFDMKILDFDGQSCENRWTLTFPSSWTLTNVSFRLSLKPAPRVVGSENVKFCLSACTSLSFLDLHAIDCEDNPH